MAREKQSVADGTRANVTQYVSPVHVPFASTAISSASGMRTGFAFPTRIFSGRDRTRGNHLSMSRERERESSRIFCAFCAFYARDVGKVNSPSQSISVTPESFRSCPSREEEFTEHVNRLQSLSTPPESRVFTFTRFTYR